MTRAERAMLKEALSNVRAAEECDAAHRLALDMVIELWERCAQQARREASHEHSTETAAYKRGVADAYELCVLNLRDACR